MTLTRAIIAAPLLILAYGIIRIIDGLDGVRGPGWAWTTGHLAFAAAMVLFVPVLLRMRRLAGSGRLATVAAAVALAGVAALTIQFGIDLVAGFLAADKAEMSRIQSAVGDIPGITEAVYTIGPALFYIGLVAITALLAVRRTLPAWAPVLVVADMVLLLTDKDLIPLGAVLLLAAFLPLARAARAHPAAA